MPEQQDDQWTFEQICHLRSWAEVCHWNFQECALAMRDLYRVEVSWEACERVYLANKDDTQYEVNRFPKEWLQLPGEE